MKYTEINKYVKENNLLKDCDNESGIYAITINNGIVYIGQSKDIYKRCCQHIYNTQNAMLNKEKKYLLLLSAQLGGFDVDCQTICQCEDNQLRGLEDYYIDKYKPILNIMTPNGIQDIDNINIIQLLEGIEYYFE